MERIIREAAARLRKLAGRIKGRGYDTMLQVAYQVQDEALWLEDQLRCLDPEPEVVVCDAAHASCDPDELVYPVPLHDLGGEG